ncbi:uncharacterized protein LOC116223811 isoform X2 [Clupea harengus]|uniref:Uncharacterized protein LOC116223811 isoform X2 n=1 Tax=Clupea harengus TaxID=7950 RepID=A0A6P8GF17_CLUHA|nr:uncharacterized protein LOC116223811 isoform X2 [Clupea harengus]
MEDDKRNTDTQTDDPGEKYLIRAGTRTIKLYTRVPGNVKDYCTTLLSSLDAKKQTEKTSVEECDVILAFCPVVSRLGTDVEAALDKIPDAKPCILVVMHITVDPYFVTPNSSRFAKGRGVDTVDYLCYEDGGSIKSEKISEAVFQIRRHLEEYAKKDQHMQTHEAGTGRIPAIMSVLSQLWALSMVPFKMAWGKIQAIISVLSQIWALHMVPFKMARDIFFWAWGRIQAIISVLSQTWALSMVPFKMAWGKIQAIISVLSQIWALHMVPFKMARDIFFWAWGRIQAIISVLSQTLEDDKQNTDTQPDDPGFVSTDQHMQTQEAGTGRFPAIMSVLSQLWALSMVPYKMARDIFSWAWGRIQAIISSVLSQIRWAYNTFSR